MQYGVGQGGFHAQQIRFSNLPQGVSIEPYRFVYDCGSDTGPLKPKQAKPLQWAIEHFAENDEPASKNKITVHSLYLSHFQKDHIDGAKRLAELVDLKEIVIPHLTKDQLVHLLAQQIASGQLAELTTDTRAYLDLLERATGEGPLLGNVPTTRVRPGGEPPGVDAGNEPPDRIQAAHGDLEQGAYSLDHDHSTNSSWQHKRSRHLRVVGNSRVTQATSTVWELRVWSYAQDDLLTKAVQNELNRLTFKGKPALPKTMTGLVDQNELAWAIKNRTKIQEAYERALRSQKVSFAADHNVVSLCLHSGPANGTDLLWDRTWTIPNEHRIRHLLNGSPPAGGWVGTGDALLESGKVWLSFYSHFNQDGIDRSQQWLTVLIPHHGSGSGGNFNSKLLEGPVCNAVFSAGAFNKYRHPARSVLDAVADFGVTGVMVTEHSRPGFFEHLTYSIG